MLMACCEFFSAGGNCSDYLRALPGYAAELSGMNASALLHRMSCGIKEHSASTVNCIATARINVPSGQAHGTHWQCLLAPWAAQPSFRLCSTLTTSLGL